MRKHITVEQLESLSKTKYDKLAKYFLKKYQTYSITPDGMEISHLIGFLSDHDNGEDWGFGHKPREPWIVEWTKNRKFKEDELCDALWKAVMEELK